jgi:serine/threonine-protein kinase HipA
LKLLSDKLQDLADFPFTAQEQIALAQDLATKLSIQGVQPKLSAKLQVNRSCFKVDPKV